MTKYVDKYYLQEGPLQVTVVLLCLIVSKQEHDHHVELLL